MTSTWRELLECKVCGKVGGGAGSGVSNGGGSGGVGPLFQCERNHNICGRCKDKLEVIQIKNPRGRILPQEPSFDMFQCIYFIASPVLKEAVG